MEANEVSLHEVLVFDLFRQNSDRWLSNKEISQLLPSVAPRTVRAKTKKLVTLGLLDQAEVFPSHKYKYSGKADKRNVSYVARLMQAKDVFASEIDSLTRGRGQK